jgi:hypothetical protein
VGPSACLHCLEEKVLCSCRVFLFNDSSYIHTYIHASKLNRPVVETVVSYGPEVYSACVKMGNYYEVRQIGFVSSMTLPNACLAPAEELQWISIRRAQVKVGLINLCKGLFSLNAHMYYKLKSGT